MTEVENEADTEENIGVVVTIEEELPGPVLNSSGDKLAAEVEAVSMKEAVAAKELVSPVETITVTMEQPIPRNTEGNISAI